MKRYVKSTEQQPSHEGNIGIWWLDGSKIQARCCSLDIGFNDNGVIRFSNHSIWGVPEGIIRGSVFYDARCQYYGITGTTNIADKDIINKIVESFNISDLRYEIVDV